MGSYYNFTVNTKYFIMKNILKSFQNRAWYNVVNRPLPDEEYEKLCREIYGNKYLKSYENYEVQMAEKRRYADIIDRYIGMRVRTGG